MLGRFAEEEEVARQAENNQSSSRVYPDGAGVNAITGGETSGEEIGTQWTLGEGAFRTSLGIMVFTEAVIEGDKEDGTPTYNLSRPRLMKPSNSKGEMFAKIEQFFDKIAEKFAKAVFEDINDIKHTWTNSNFPSRFEKVIKE